MTTTPRGVALGLKCFQQVKAVGVKMIEEFSLFKLLYKSFLTIDDVDAVLFGVFYLLAIKGVNLFV